MISLFFHSNFNFFTGCFVVFVTFELNNSSVFTFFVYFCNFKGCFTFAVSGCLVGFFTDF